QLFPEDHHTSPQWSQGPHEFVPLVLPRDVSWFSFPCPDLRASEQISQRLLRRVGEIAGQPGTRIPFPFSFADLLRFSAHQQGRLSIGGERLRQEWRIVALRSRFLQRGRNPRFPSGAPLTQSEPNLLSPLVDRL